MLLKPGTLLERGKYRIISALGQGGFGITYLAEQITTERKVCIKEFFPKGYYTREGDSSAVRISSQEFFENMERFKSKFIKEAKTVAKLDHPNIIHIHDAFEENDTAYYVMEYVEGESLSDRVKRCGAMTEAEAVSYIKQVASALGHIHAEQIMHLDVKPGNIMVRAKDNRTILIDFGLSKHYDATSGEATSTTPVGVSHGFAPMEQYRPGGVSTFSPETDIYSLGATLYYLVTGSTPPMAADVSDDGLPELPAHLSQSVRATIQHAMEDKRKNRPHSIDEFMSLLNGASTTVTSRDTERTIINDAVQKPIINGHEYVDLGLSVKWATCNVGANSPEGYGNYYAWGETTSKSSYTEANCKTLRADKVVKSSFFGLLKDEQIQYRGVNLGDIAGDKNYDAATANWGSGWRMPTKAEFDELRNKNNCDWTWTKRNGVNGYEVKSKKNGNSIFLPAAGWRYGDDVLRQGSHGDYWSSTPYDTDYACYLYFSSGGHDTGWDYRYYGLSVRPVAE